MTTIKKILAEYPAAQSIYNTGKYLAVTLGEVTILMDPNTLKADRMLPTYSQELADICKSAIPVWPDDLDDPEQSGG